MTNHTAQIRQEIQSYGRATIAIGVGTLLTVAAIWLWLDWATARPWTSWGVLALALRGYIAVSRINHWAKQ